MLVWPYAPGFKHHAEQLARLLGPSGVLQPVDEHALVVALPELHLQTQLVGGPAAEIFDVAEPRGSVQFGLARPQQIEIGSVEHEDSIHHALLACDSNPLAVILSRSARRFRARSARQAAQANPNRWLSSATCAASASVTVKR